MSEPVGINIRAAERPDQRKEARAARMMVETVAGRGGEAAPLIASLASARARSLAAVRTSR